jgi:proteasome accessory factor C
MAKRTQAERFRAMLALLPYMRRGERIRTAQLAELLGSTTEDVVADLWKLTMVGVPPYTPDMMLDLDISDDETYVAVMSDPPALDHTVRLTAPETRALEAALQACGVRPGDPLLDRLDAATAADADPAEMAHLVSASLAPEGAGAVYVSIARAVAECEVVEIDYFSAGRGATSVRRIHPYVLENHRGAWYLSAFCESAGEDRVFRLDRVRRAEPTGERFDPPADPPAPSPDLTGRDDLKVAEVLFEPGAAIPEDREWPGIECESQADGATLVRVPYDTPEWLARRVVARLGAARVVSPDEVRDAASALAVATISEYEGVS